MAWNDTKNCPVCKKEILVSGLRNHIIGKAKSELFRWYFKRTEKRIHMDYIAKNTVFEKVEKWKLK